MGNNPTDHNFEVYYEGEDFLKKGEESNFIKCVDTMKFKTSSLERKLSLLEDVLEPVLSSPPVLDKEEKLIENKNISPLHKFFDETNDMLCSLEEKMDILIKRVDL